MIEDLLRLSLHVELRRAAGSDDVRRTIDGNRARRLLGEAVGAFLVLDDDEGGGFGFGFGACEWETPRYRGAHQ